MSDEDRGCTGSQGGWDTKVAKISKDNPESHSLRGFRALRVMNDEDRGCTGSQGGWDTKVAKISKGQSGKNIRFVVFAPFVS